APFGNVTSQEPIGATFSPNGKWVAYASIHGPNTSPDSGIFIQPFPATGTIYQAPKVRLEGRSFHPAWTPDGKTLFSVPGSANPFAAMSVNTQPSVTFGSPVVLLQAVPRPGLISTDVRGYDFLPDGRILTVVSGAEQDATGGARPEVRVVLNWFDELKRLVPGKGLPIKRYLTPLQWKPDAWAKFCWRRARPSSLPRTSISLFCKS